MSSLRVSEIYPSIQGESTHAGRPCVFIRLTGCPLRCVWCDTTYAFTGGERQSILDVVETAVSFGLDTVEVTGGEPLAQKECLELLRLLPAHFGTVLLETSGAISTEGIDARVRVILDLKAPGSGESERNLWANLDRLRDGDELKIVLAHRADYDWARGVLTGRRIPDGVPVHFSPVHGELDSRELAEWMVQDRLPVRLQLQQHKFIWDPEARGV